jgi:hypothetical protein
VVHHALAHFPGDDLFTPLTRRRGLPIGNLTSQFFANVLLDRLDHAVVDRRRHGRYLRYCDDLAMFGDDLGALNALRAFVDDTLAGLRLKAHPRKSRVRRVDEGLTFLGFVVRRGSLRLGQVGLARFRRGDGAARRSSRPRSRRGRRTWRRGPRVGSCGACSRPRPGGPRPPEARPPSHPRCDEAAPAPGGRAHVRGGAVGAGQAGGFEVEAIVHEDLSGVRAPVSRGPGRGVRVGRGERGAGR